MLKNIGNDKNFMRYHNFYPQNGKVCQRTKQIQASAKNFKRSASSGNRALADKVF